MDDAKHDLPTMENTEAERMEQLRKDKAAADSFARETEMLIKQLESLKKIDQIVLETDHASRFKNLKYVEREEDPELKSLFEQKTS